VRERGSKTQANVLVGRSPQVRWSEVLGADDWRVADDPLFNEALEVIESIATEPPPQNPTDLQLSSANRWLTSAVEFHGEVWKLKMGLW
jgi:hypothetical protein